DCSGESIWGVDVNGDSLIGEKIRHHRMPDSTLFPIDDDALIDSYEREARLFPIRLGISNVDIPLDIQGDLQGFYIVKSVREDNSSTVLDTGMLGGVVYQPGYTDGETGEVFPDTIQSNVELSYKIGITGGSEYLDVGILVSPRAQFRKDIKP